MDIKDLLARLPIAQNFVQTNREKELLAFEDVLRKKLTQRIESGQPLGKKKKYLVFNEKTGQTEQFDPTKFGLGPDDDVNILRVNPGAGDRESEAELKRREKLEGLTGALSSKTYVDPMGMETPLATRKDAIKLALQLSFNPADPRLKKLIDAFPETVEAPETESVIVKGVKSAANATASAVKKAFGGKGTVRVQDSTGRTGEIPKASLKKAQQMDPGLKVLGE